jgi:hypothetical protein
MHVAISFCSEDERTIPIDAPNITCVARWRTAKFPGKASKIAETAGWSFSEDMAFRPKH